MQSSPVFSRNIAIVGTGPTGLYTLFHLIQSPTPLTITLFERGSLAGVGLPYGPDATAAGMLANIASIEIPTLGETYLDWLQRQPAAFLSLYGVAREDLNERAFLPRLLLGGWLRDRLDWMFETARARGHRIALREGVEVSDVKPVPGGLRLTFRAGAGEPESQLFTHVVLSTGHDWPEQDKAEARIFVSPWTGLIDTAVPAARVGILGTSLSAIDAAMAVAGQHGHFRQGSDGTLEFALSPKSWGLHLSLMSRQGLLPEADFWCPLPYQPLRHFTDDALKAAVRTGDEGVLDRIWPLFVRELEEADPVYAARIGRALQTPEGFARAYFAPRLECDPFVHAAANLAEVEQNTARRHTVGWRYAILRIHEVAEGIFSRLSSADGKRFHALKRVFIDNYAAVPPDTIRRILALHRAGILSVLRLGADYQREDREALIRVTTEAGVLHDFDVFIDARGQSALLARDLPFAGLRAAFAADRPVPMDASFRLKFTEAPVYLPAAPYLLGRMPFAQGITTSAAMGEAVATDILRV